MQVTRWWKRFLRCMTGLAGEDRRGYVCQSRQSTGEKENHGLGNGVTLSDDKNSLELLLLSSHTPVDPQGQYWKCMYSHAHGWTPPQSDDTLPM